MTYLQEDPDALGVHLHVSLDEARGKTWWLGLQRVCGALLGLPCLLLHSDFNDVIGRYRHHHKQYGAIDGVRYCWFKNEGGHREHNVPAALRATPDGMEYRSLGGLLMKSPELFTAAATIFEYIVKAYVQNKYIFPKRLMTDEILYCDRKKAEEMLSRYEVWDTLSAICPKEPVQVIQSIVNDGGMPGTKDDILPAWRPKAEAA